MTPSSSRAARIAIAEDDPTQHQLLKSLVARIGHQVVFTVENGQQAIEQCCDMQVDLILMDLDLPEVDGLEAADQISEWGISVDLIGGMPDVENIVLKMEPVVTWLYKPTSLAALNNAIDQGLSAST